MKLSLSGVFADAGAMWRSERKLIAPVAGVFFTLPMLGIVLLLDGIQIAPDATPEQLRAALTGFYDAHIVPLLLISLLLDFGSFALLNLFLQGGGRTLGQVLALTLQRFFLFEVIAIAARVLLTIGASLFLLPGLFAYARIWLAAPGFAAQPEAGLTGAAREGWMLSRGFVWITLLGIMAVVFVAGMFALFVLATLFGTIAAAIGDAMFVPMLGYVVCALFGSLIWTALALLRVAAYRLAKQGI
ncbi:MAG: hypothetical protein EOP59_11145 [Sphingomonadales bacterium]|nr:MAG: hypothetical protein EOP59_11145 [Sphingomonadales bacterium]